MKNIFEYELVVSKTIISYSRLHEPPLSFNGRVAGAHENHIRNYSATKSIRLKETQRTRTDFNYPDRCNIFLFLMNWSI